MRSVVASFLIEGQALAQEHQELLAAVADGRLDADTVIRDLKEALANRADSSGRRNTSVVEVLDGPVEEAGA